MQFNGTLQPQGDPNGSLKTSLNLIGSRVEITAGGEALGSWPISQVKAERIEGNRFELSLGDDRAVFLADDALAFSYEALPRLAKNPLMEVAQGFRFKLKGNRAKSPSQSPEEPEAEPENEFVTSAVEDVSEDTPPNVKRLRDLIEAARANRTDDLFSVDEGDSVAEPDWDEAVVFADPVVAVVSSPVEPSPVESSPVGIAEPKVVAAPLWAEGGLARRRAEPEPPAADLTPRFSAPQDLTHRELLDELELLMRAVQSGSVSDSNVPALTSLIRSLRSLVD